MRLFWYLRALFKAWNYKRKFGMDISEGVREYGRWIILTEKKDDKPNA